MIPTYIGAVVALVGIFLLIRGSAQAMFGFLICCGPFGGAAAIALPALGGSTIPPVTFCLAFLVLRLLLPGAGLGRLISESARANIFLLIFVAYGIIMAYLGPRMFGLDIKVVPMRAFDTNIYSTYPLVFSAQNITASVYLAGTFMCAMSAYVACRLEGGAKMLVRAAIIVVSVHMFFGITSVLFAGTPYRLFLDLFRNGNYAQLDQSVGGYVRMAGIMPEPSAFAGFGFIWMAFMAECWYRDVRSNVTGPLAIAMLFTLLLSTSSTAYISVGGYAVLFFARLILVPVGVRSNKVLILALLGLVGSTLTSVILLMQPGLVRELTDIVLEMTVNKSTSLSGIQRAFWAKQGLNAFFASSGVGVGPGSFRSSSIVTAILGATGLVGSVSFVLYLITIIKPLRASTYHRVTSSSDATGVAAAWAAFCVLIPASVGSPTADPGTDFAILAGASLALRLKARKAAPRRMLEPVEMPAGGPPVPLLNFAPVMHEPDEA
jgi:hypothetical protein